MARAAPTAECAGRPKQSHRPSGLLAQRHSDAPKASTGLDNHRLSSVRLLAKLSRVELREAAPWPTRS